jgi:GT2 family glycosyltransferase
MSIEVVILQHNESDLTIKCIESVRAQVGCDLVLTLVDQASEPTHREAIRGLGDATIENTENRPIFDVWSELIALSSHEHVCLLNNDTYLADTCLSRLSDALSREPTMAWASAVSQRYAAWDHCMVDFPAEVVEKWESQPEVLNAWAHSLKSTIRYFDRIEMAAFMVNSDSFREIGCFDYESFGGHFQELDYGRRAQQIGHCFAVRYDAVFWHWQHRTVPGAIRDGSWRSVTVPESETAIRAKYPGIDPYALKELPCP